MIEPCEAFASRVGNIVARMLRDHPGQTVLLEWAERSVLVYDPNGNDEVREEFLCVPGAVIESVDRCDCHAVG